MLMNGAFLSSGFLPSSVAGIVTMDFLHNHDCKVMDGVIRLAKMFSHWSVYLSMVYICCAVECYAHFYVVRVLQCGC